MGDDPDAGRGGRERSRELLLEFFGMVWRPLLVTIGTGGALCLGLLWLVPNFVGGMIAGGLLVGLGWMWSVLALRQIPLPNVLLGAEGEVAVGAVLDALSTNGVEHLDDVHWSVQRHGVRIDFNIDHVVVSGGRVWCLETKSTVSESVRYLHGAVDGATRQVQDNAKSIRQALMTTESFSGGRKVRGERVPLLKISPTPVVVLVGWPREQPDVSVVNGVTVVREQALARWLQAELEASTCEADVDMQRLVVTKIREQSLFHRSNADMGTRPEFVVYGPIRMLQMCWLAILVFLGVIWVALQSMLHVSMWGSIGVATLGAIVLGILAKKKVVSALWLGIAVRAASVGLAALAVPILVVGIYSVIS